MIFVMLFVMIFFSIELGPRFGNELVKWLFPPPPLSSGPAHWPHHCRHRDRLRLNVRAHLHQRGRASLHQGGTEFDLIALSVTGKSLKIDDFFCCTADSQADED